MGYINMTTDVFQYKRVNQRELMLAVKDDITTLCVDGPAADLFALIGGMVFPKVADLSVKKPVLRTVHVNWLLALTRTRLLLKQLK